MTSPEFCEREFDLGEITLRGRLYGEGNPSPLLALHGWLDNCASFEFLAPLLAHQGYQVLALDLAGHGLSEHRASVGAYNVWQDIPELLLVLDQLQWKEFALVGHSRGGIIANLLSACFPEKIAWLGLIDGVVPFPLEDEQVLEQLRKAVQGAVTIREKKRKYYANFTEAVSARENGFFPLGHTDALTLAKRGVKEDSKGYYWSNDAKLTLPSEVKFSKNQLHCVIESVQAKTQLIIAEEGVLTSNPDALAWLEKYPRFKDRQILAGKHHLHMSEHAERVAQALLA